LRANNNFLEGEQLLTLLYIAKMIAVNGVCWIWEGKATFERGGQLLRGWVVELPVVASLCVISVQIWYVRRPPSDRGCRRRTYSTSEPSVGDVGEPIKLSADSGVDVTEINLVDMNPDDIRVSPLYCFVCQVIVRSGTDLISLIILLLLLLLFCCCCCCLFFFFFFFFNLLGRHLSRSLRLQCVVSNRIGMKSDRIVLHVNTWKGGKWKRQS